MKTPLGTHTDDEQVETIPRVSDVCVDTPTNDFQNEFQEKYHTEKNIKAFKKCLQSRFTWKVDVFKNLNNEKNNVN